MNRLLMQPTLLRLLWLSRLPLRFSPHAFFGVRTGKVVSASAPAPYQTTKSNSSQSDQFRKPPILGKTWAVRRMLRDRAETHQERFVVFALGGDTVFALAFA